MALSRNNQLETVSASDKAFVWGFETCTLPENEWTHLAHIRAAWIYLNLLPYEKALQKLRHGILLYNTAVLNRRHKYHETVTVAFTQIVASRIVIGENWLDFAARIEDVLDSQSPILLRYYSNDCLYSDAARESFVEPDIELLPSVD